MTAPHRSRSRRTLVTVAMIVIFLVPAFLGFGNKFLEFLALVNDEEGAFTIVPILNYLLASLGFFMLLIWAMFHGMFHDVEKPKYAMLQRERMLDEEEESTSDCRAASAD